MVLPPGYLLHFYLRFQHVPLLFRPGPFLFTLMDFFFLCLCIPEYGDAGDCREDRSAENCDFGCRIIAYLGEGLAGYEKRHGKTDSGERSRSPKLSPGIGLWFGGKAQLNSGYGGSDKSEWFADDQCCCGAEH